MGVHQYEGGMDIQAFKQNEIYQLLDRFHLSTEVGKVPTVQTCPYELIGDTVKISWNVIYLIGTGASLTFNILGSHEGQSYDFVATQVQPTVGYNSLILQDTVHNMFKGEVVLTSTAPDAQSCMSLNMEFQIKALG